MKKNLLWKTVFIVAVMVVFLFGIFGIPQSLSGSGLLASLQSRIHLGLDLKGGTHLILQVMVNDAVNADSDHAVERLKQDLKDSNVAYAEISKPDPQNAPDRIQIKGVPPESSSEFRRVVEERLPDYMPSSGPDNSWVLSMNPLRLLTSRIVRSRRPSKLSVIVLTSSASANRSSKSMVLASIRSSSSFPVSTIPPA
jgi:preprotein translocase subunit SecD